jgi:hypothetical protein
MSTHKELARHGLFDMNPLFADAVRAEYPEDGDLIIKLMKRDPSLSIDGARGLLQQHRDHVAEQS